MEQLMYSINEKNEAQEIVWETKGRWWKGKMNLLNSVNSGLDIPSEVRPVDLTLREGEEVPDTVFSETFSDALDADFTIGSIKHCFFTNCCNDAIDVSGSTVNIHNIHIDNAGDKGLSAGEKSYINASQVNVSNTDIALASKDMSELEINDIKIYDCGIGFTAYQKKSEFGPGAILAAGLVMDKVDIPYLIEENSELRLEGKRVKSSRKDTKEILSRYLKNEEFRIFKCQELPLRT